MFNVITGEHMLIPEPCPEQPIKDIHCLYTHDQRYIMGDGYPDKDGYRWLHFIEVETSKDVVLGKYYSYYRDGNSNEFRYDLHARYDRTGRYVSFDSNHIGNRCVCMLDLNDVKGCVYHV